MSTNTPATTTTQDPDGVVLPPGWSVGPFRETSQANQLGQVVQGVLFPLTNQAGSGTTVFIPYSMLSDIPGVQAAFSARIAALSAITG